MGSDSPLMRGLRAELDRQAKEAAASAAEEARNQVINATQENERSYSARAEEIVRQMEGATQTGAGSGPLRNIRRGFGPTK